MLRRKRAARAAGPMVAVPGLRADTLALIDPRRGLVRAPVRADLFGAERFRQHGFSLAKAQLIERRRRWPRRIRTPHFFPRIAANLRSLERSLDYLQQVDKEGEALSPAAEWLLDNYHLIESQVAEIHSGLPGSYYAALPKLRVPPLQGLPRVYGIAWAFVSHTDANFDARLLTQFVDAYQQVDVLTLAELWAIPTTLRVVLLENLDRLAEAVAGHKAAQEAADWFSDHENELTLQQLLSTYQRLQERGLQTSFVAQMVQRMRHRSASTPSPWADWLADVAPTPDAALALAHELHAADNVSVSNAVSALHAINSLDWRSWIGGISPVLQMLQRSPAFEADSDLTRDQCTHTIERMASRLRRSESEVCRRLLELDAREGGAEGAGPAHWLIGPGRARLIAELGGKPRAIEPAGLQWLWRLRGLFYVLALALGTGALLRLLLGAHPAASAWLGLALLPAGFAAFETVLALVNRILAESVRVHRLPRLALDDGLRPEDETLVVMPCMLGSAEGIAALAHRLEQHHLASAEPHARYALLSDWADAPKQRVEADQALLDSARRAIEALNQRHPVGEQELPRFALLHRERSWNATEQVWMGWERKRGKIEQLVAQLAAPEGAAGPSPFVELGSASRLGPGVRYLLTLDADTEMPPGVLRTLVAIAAHPLNAPQLDPRTQRVVGGYGILQPHIVAPLPRPGELTLFGWLFSGPWGLDVYNAGSSEIYQDVFGQGSFSGKGLLHVQAMHRSLQGRIAENQLLSHDLYEGVWARAAHVSDVSVVESAPMHPDVAASRVHRWTRGDWQLLPLFGPALRGRVGLLNLWKMADNLRRSLLAPLALLMLWLSCTLGVLAPSLALGLVAAALGLGPLMGALAALLPSRRDLAMGHFLREGGQDLARAIGGTLWLLLTLPLAASRQVDAVLRTLWRLTVSRRHLLQWTTAAQAQAAARYELAWFWRQHRAQTLLAVLWMATGALLPAAHLGWLLGLGLVWSLMPLWLWASSQPLRGAQDAQALEPPQREYLMQLARDTWSLFQSTVSAADHHLPPDNLQIEPEPMLARRTSPTNIGLYLASCVSAQRLGLIGLPELTERLRATLDTLDRLPRVHGHFHNWIDTASLATLQPPYVSTVDSGNLAALLWMTAQACRELAQTLQGQAQGGQPPMGQDLAPRLNTLAARMDAITAAMEFGFLYDRKRRLFRIGYRPVDACLDPAYYDLMASESRLGSYVAIAKGDVPLAHWQALARPFLSVEGAPTLRSWSGSMFEYLMPSLLMREPRTGLLQRSTLAAVRAQQAFGAAHGLPWGVSESAYFEQDASLAFQYGPFGVPQLALRRTPEQDRVVAPYATVLALLADAPAAIANLHVLERLGARDSHGFIEALDFSPSRLGEARTLQRVATYMAHHQGMSMLALCNLLCEEAPRGWFERAPRAEAFAILLHERMPRSVVFQTRAIPRPPHKGEDQPAASGARLLLPSDAAPGALPTLLLGNGAYSVYLRPNGAGQSRWRGQAINRARDDLLRDAHGSWHLLRAAGSADWCSLTEAPLSAARARYRTRFYADHAEFDASTSQWESELAVWVSPDDDVELRRLTLHNLGEQEAEFELMSLFEAVLAPQRAEESHPAFFNLFVRAHAAGPDCLLLERPPRLEGERSMWVAHFLAHSDCAADTEMLGLHIGCSRSELLPRRGDMLQLRATAPGATAGPGNSSDLETGLDPAATLHVRLRLPARVKRCITFATAAAGDPETLMALVDEYRQEVHLTRSRLMAATLARIRQRELRLSSADLQLIQDLSTPMTMNCSRARPAPAAALDRRALWRLSISGDRPLVLVRINSLAGLRVVRTLLTAHRMWDMVGLTCDLVVLNGEAPSYLMPLRQSLQGLRQSVGSDPHSQPERGGVHLLQQAELGEAELAALAAIARIDLLADGRPLARLLAQALRAATSAAEGLSLAARHLATRGQRQLPWPEPDARGEFSADGRHFDIHLDARSVTPRPWANVLANPRFGCIVTESGGGYTWAGNSGMHQLTPWSNDALLDPAGEHFWVERLDSGEVFGLLPALERNGVQGVHVSHRAGMSVFSQQRSGLALETTVMVHPELSAKVLRLRLICGPEHGLRLRLLGMVEWIIGAQRRDRMTLQTDYDGGLQAALATQLEQGGGFGGGTAYLMLVGPTVSQWTCERGEFFDPQGALLWPERLQAAHGFALDPCAALGGELALLPGQTLELFWVLGYAPSREAAREQALALRAPGVLEALGPQVDRHWDDLLGGITVRTPDPLFDALVNRWLLYQVLACRLWARAGFYQASGATGYRDQLQDAMARAPTRPDLLRRQILIHAARQFPQGDVQHWWHDPGGAGVRTHVSDDLLWLPHALHHYLRCSGDQALLDETLSFIDGPEVPGDAEDAYYTPSESSERASLFEHAARAIDHALRWGAHGLPLMGSGDWNDGMNRVGHAGRGESVWMAWFLIVILRDWVPLAQSRGNAARAARWQQAIEQLRTATAEHGWDGEWYRRAYFDNGHPLGSIQNEECRIDLIAQAWSVFASPAGDARAAQAMASADARLVDRQHRVLRLLDPPLQLSPDHAGYIQAYPPGVRENGGQYSHGAVWALMAQARLGHAELAWDYFRMLSPAHRTLTPVARQRYGIEPYVMPGDTYTAAPYAGRGGWSWYTGSAAWLYRAALESLLGLQLEPGRLRLQPCLPPPWPWAELQLRVQGREIELRLQRSGQSRPEGWREISPGAWFDFGDQAGPVRLLLTLPEPD